MLDTYWESIKIGEEELKNPTSPNCMLSELTKDINEAKSFLGKVVWGYQISQSGWSIAAKFLNNERVVVTRGILVGIKQDSQNPFLVHAEDNDCFCFGFRYKIEGTN